MLARLGEHLLQIRDAREDRRDGDEAHADRVGEQPRDRGLAGAGRPPEDHRGELARRHHPPDRAVRRRSDAPGRPPRRAAAAAAGRRAAHSRRRGGAAGCWGSVWKRSATTAPTSSISAASRAARRADARSSHRGHIAAAPSAGPARDQRRGLRRQAGRVPTMVKSTGSARADDEVEHRAVAGAADAAEEIAPSVRAVRRSGA